jgi:vitamin B12 transporter
LDERYFPGFGNPALEPEYASTFDAGVLKELSPGDISLTYFGTDTNNLIIALPIDAFGDVKPFNVARARVRGAALTANLRLGAHTLGRLAYSDNFQAVDAANGRRLPYRPAMTLSAQLWRSSGPLDTGVDGRIVGSRLAPAAAGDVRLPPYVLADAFVGRSLGPAVKATLRWENIGARHTEEEVLGYPAAGSMLSLRLSVTR